MKQGLSNITGQSSLKELLLSSIDSGRISHAYIFEGESGMGKKTLAYAFACQLICEVKNACGSCYDCRLALSGNHPDIITVTPDEDKQSISVDNIRALYETVMVKPYSADKKIIVIPNAEKLGHQAQNALLKMLEEPPSYIVFMLLTSNSNYFLETVLSRCIKISLLPYTDEEILIALENQGYSNVPSAVISCSDGNVGRALSLMTGGSFLEMRKELAGLFDLFFDSKPRIYEMISFLEQNKESAGDIFEIFLSFARELIMCHLCADEISRSDDFNAAGYVSRTSLKGCMAFLNKVIETKKMLLSNVNFSLLVNSFALSSREVLGW